MKAERLVLFHRSQHPEVVLPFPASIVPLLGSARLLTLSVKPQAGMHAGTHTPRNAGLQVCMRLSFGTTV